MDDEYYKRCREFLQMNNISSDNCIIDAHKEWNKELIRRYKYDPLPFHHVGSSGIFAQVHENFETWEPHIAEYMIHHLVDHQCEGKRGHSNTECFWDGVSSRCFCKRAIINFDISQVDWNKDVHLDILKPAGKLSILQ